MLCSMKCLECPNNIPDSFFAAWADSPQAKSGRFDCPHCGAHHVRREIGRTPEGKPLYSVRIWGHPTTTRKPKRDRDNR
jgi:hypothetical protein